MSKFQIALLVIFGAFIVFAVIIFSLNRGGSGQGNNNISIWGTLSRFDFDNMVTTAGISTETLSFNYVEKKAETFSQDFTEALAVGEGPDLIILPVESLLKEKNKLMLIPSESVRQADFVNTFIKEGELFLESTGTYALPMYVDPMVLYWNRDLFAKAGLANPPVYWDEIYNFTSKLTQRDNAGNITTSAIALGEARNIPNFKEVLSLLMLQAGTPIVSNVGPSLRSVLLDNSGFPQVPSVAALEFYTQFANPQKSFYSWNKSLLSAPTHFTSGRSAMYLGFASELGTLKAKSPTLDLGISPVPQSRVSGRVVTFGKLYGVALVRSARNPGAALSGAISLVSRESSKALASATSLVPARRDVLSERPSDPSGFVFYGAALLSGAWLDPDSSKTKEIFREMIESVTSGRVRIDQAVSNANTSLNTLLE